MIAFFVEGVTDGPPEDCSAAEFHPNVLGAQTEDTLIDLPPGVGVAIPPTTGLRFQLHFVNAGSADAIAGVTTRFHVAAPGSIRDHAGQLLFSNGSITIPPDVPTDVTRSCAAPSDVFLLGASPHTHQHAVNFKVSTGGSLLFETKDLVEPVPHRFDPPFHLPAGQDVTFTCSYVNPTGRTITFGESAVSNEMCILGAIYYPVVDPASPNITCF